MGLYLIAAEASLLSSIGSWTVVILKVAFGLGMVIFVHELGHFLVAKACGVKCEKFYIGFDVPIKIGPFTLPSSLWKYQWGETLYGIGIIPLGGYVKMLGQDDNPAKAAEEEQRTKIRGNADQPVGETPASGDAHQQQQGEDAQPPQEEQVEIDPRSYTAKSVPQRMAIISAGVIMNVIFAVIFATIAFGRGVSYTPCEVGTLVPGGAAWTTALLHPGDRVVQIGKRGTRNEHLRFQRDLLMNVVMTGGEEDLDLLVRHRDGQEQWITIRPKKLTTDSEFSTLGILSSAEPRLVSESPVFAHLPAGKAEEPFQEEDIIVAFEIDGQRHDIDDYVQLREFLAQHPDEPLTFVVQREGKQPTAETGPTDGGSPSGKSPQEVKIQVDKNPLRWLGLMPTIGPITAIQQKSPAALAGLKIGDVIRTIDGQEVGDPITLPHRLRRLAGKEVEIGVVRNSGSDSEKTIQIKVTPRKPTSYQSIHFPGQPLSIEALGAAYSLLNTVQKVQPGSPAAAAGLGAGDQILSVRFIAADEEKKNFEQQELMLLDKKLDLGKKLYWLAVHDRMQISLPDTKVRLTYRRGTGKPKTADLAIIPHKGWFSANRGIRLEAKSEPLQAESWGEAFTLGLRETKESLLHVFKFLRKLVSGKISPTALGGPGQIAVVATREAREGISRLLLFLTLLSANLAIVNFLPIPVLDGGHMVFLAFEGIRGKPVDEVWAFRLTMLGLTFILCLMVFVIGLDVYRLSPLGG